MSLTVCTFAGHREVFLSSVKQEIDKALLDIVQTEDEYVFYSGGMGDFDIMCEAAVWRVKKKYPHLNIRLNLVLPYMTNQINRDKEYLESRFDDIIIPMDLMGVHYKAAIKKRNRWMVDQADKILAYVYRDFGGAFDIRLDTMRSTDTEHQHINWPRRKDPAAKTAGYIRV